MDFLKLRRVKKELTIYAQLLGERGLTFSCFGNISIRVENKVVIKKKGVNLELAKPSDFLIFSLGVKDGFIKDRDNLSSEWRMHLLSYLMNPDYRVIFHLHPFFLSLLDKLNLELESDDLEFKYLLGGKIKILPPLEPGTDTLAQTVAQELKSFPFLILKQHGIVIAGQDLPTTYNYALTAETVARRLIYLSLFDRKNA